MTDFTIEAANAGDIGALLAVQEECGLSPWTRAGYESEMTRNDSLILIARDGVGMLVGFIAGRLDVAAEAEIYNIATRPEARNKGVGSSLLQTFLGRCLEAGASRVWLEVRRSNQTAISFYRHYGFVKSGTRKSFYSAPTEDAEVMSLRLKKDAG